MFKKKEKNMKNDQIDLEYQLDKVSVVSKTRKGVQKQGNGRPFILAPRPLPL